jgi:hypothetical protein
MPLAVGSLSKRAIGSIFAFLSAVIEDDTFAGGLEYSAFSVQDVHPDGSLRLGFSLRKEELMRKRVGWARSE